MIVIRYCLCGGTMRAWSTPPAASKEIGELFDRLHTGEGHGPATRAAAAQARRREDQARAGREDT